MTQQVIGGVDTHGSTHHGAVIDAGLGRQLGDREFPATSGGYRDLAGWLAGYGEVVAVGVEGTGAYGAELARQLAAAGVRVVEVDRPDRRVRRSKGKSDPIDAYAAAAAVASGRATGAPKSRVGTVESIRMLRVARSSAVKARTQAMNQIRMLLVTAPGVLREQVAGLGPAALIGTLARLRPGADLQSPVNAAKFTLRRLARRHQSLGEEIDELSEQIAALVAAAAP
jgi:transposase